MIELLLLLIGYLFVLAKPVYAYLDPGTGSYITQLAIGFMVGGLYMLKIYWRKLVLFFEKSKQKVTDETKHTDKRS